MRSVRIVTVVLCQLFLASLLLADEQAIPQQVLDLQKAAAQRQKSGDTAGSIRECETIIQAYPNTKYALQAHQEIAILLIQTKSFDAAQERIDLITSKFIESPDAAESLYHIARHYGWNGLSDKSLELHQYNVATYKPQQKALWSQVEIIADSIRRTNWSEAEQDYDFMLSAFNNEPTLTKEIWQISRLYADAGLNDRALELCRVNAEKFPNTEYGAISQGEIVVNCLQRKDLSNAQLEYHKLLSQFDQEPLLCREIYRIAGNYAIAGDTITSTSLYRYNADRFAGTDFGRWSRAELVFGAIRKKDFAQAQQEYEAFIAEYAKEPTLPKEIHSMAQEYKKAGNSSKALELHQYNAASFHNSEYGVLSQGEIVRDCIANEDVIRADAEYAVMLLNFADNPMLAREIYGIAGIYNVKGKIEQSLNMYRFNAQQHVNTDFGRWSHVEVVRALIRKKDFANAKNVASAFALQYAAEPTLAKELYLFGREFAAAGDRETGFQQHLHNILYAKEANEKRWSNVEVIFYYIDKNDHEKAASACVQFAESYADHPDFGMEVRNVVNRCASNGNISEGEALCNAIIAAYPGNENMIWVSGALVQVYLYILAEEDAFKEYEALLHMYSNSPKLVQVVENLSNTCIGNNDIGLAVSFYSRLLSQYPDHPDALNAMKSLVVALLKMNASAMASEKADDLINKYSDDPQIVPVLEQLVKEFIGHEQFAKANELQQYLHTLVPNATQKVSLQGDTAVALILNNQKTEAAAIVEKIKQEQYQDISFFIALNKVAEAYKQAGDYGESIQLFSFLCNSGADTRIETDARVSKAIVHQIVNDDESVSAEVEALIAKASELPAVDWAVYIIGEEYFIRGELLRTQGNRAESQEYYRKAMAVWKRILESLRGTAHEPEAYLFSGICYKRLEQYQLAVNYFEKVISEWPDYMYVDSAYNFIGLCLEKMKSLNLISSAQADARIEEVYRTVVEKYPDYRYYRTPCRQLGIFYYERHQWHQAIKCFESFLSNYNREDGQEGNLSDVLYRIAKAYEFVGEYASAAENYKIFIELSAPSKRKTECIGRLERVNKLIQTR